jgi:phosphatidylglycerol:prolipoprotein diacylglycerol transferase
LFYDPSYYFIHPWDAIDPRKPGFAIEGGLLASAGVFWVFVRKMRLDFLAYADTLIWGMPWGCGIGRIGCFLIHDHPGTLSNFILATKYPDGKSRHDLGLYLSLVGFAIGLIFLFLNRKKRAPGFWFGSFLILDSASRLWLDFYRIADVRYLGMTPTQWLAVPMIGVGVWMVALRQGEGRSSE